MANEIWVNHDMAKGLVDPHQLAGLTYTGSNAGDTFGVHILRNGVPSTELAGRTVTGYLIRPDQQTVVIAGAISGSDVTVTLPSEAYAYSGRCSLVIRVSDTDGVKIPVFAAYFNIGVTSTDETIDPGELIPSLEDLLAQIDAMEAATNAAQLLIANYEDRMSVAVVKSVNLYNKTTRNIGLQLYADGSEHSNADYDTSDYIPVTPSVRYYAGYWVDGDPGAWGTSQQVISICAFYDASKTLITPTIAADVLRTTGAVAPANAAFMRFSINRGTITNASERAMVVESALPAVYAGYWTLSPEITEPIAELEAAVRETGDKISELKSASNKVEVLCEDSTTLYSFVAKSGDTIYVRRADGASFSGNQLFFYNERKKQITYYNLTGSSRTISYSNADVTYIKITGITTEKILVTNQSVYLANETLGLVARTDAIQGDIGGLQGTINAILNRTFLEKCKVVTGKKVDTSTNAIIDDADSKILLVPYSVRKNAAAIVSIIQNSNKLLCVSENLSYVSRFSGLNYASGSLLRDSSYEYLAISYNLSDTIDATLLTSDDLSGGIKVSATHGTLKRSANLLDKTQICYGIGSSNSAFTYSENYNATNLMPVSNGDTIYSEGLSSSVYMTLLDSSFSVLGRTTTSAYSGNKFRYEVTNQSAAWAFFWCNKTTAVNFAADGLYFVKSEAAMHYEPYYVVDPNTIQLYMPNNQVYQDNVLSAYRGTVWAALGDSLTASGSGGHYLTYIRSILRLSDYVNGGIGGTRMSGTDATAMWQDARINALGLNAIMITIMAGTNDAPYTTVADSDFTRSNCDVSNFVGAYNVCLSKLYYKYLKTSGYYSSIDYSGVVQVGTALSPDTFRIILITPPKMLGSEENEVYSETFASHVKRIAAMWGLPCVDANANMSWNDLNKTSYFPTGTPDYTHFSEMAHKNLASLIIAKAREIEPLD